MSRRVFKPRLIPAAVALLMFSVALALAAWQMSRSAEKLALINSYKSAPSLPAIGSEELAADWYKYRYRRIELTGSYDGEHQILLENQIFNSQSGYIVLTPFKLRDTGATVLVNRGWIARSADSPAAVKIAVNSEQRKISGLLNTPPQVGIKLGSLDDSPPGWPKAIPYIDNEWLALQIAADIKPWAVMLVDDEIDSFVRQWKPSLRMGPEKHKGYAFQWFSLAIALILIFVVTSFQQIVEDSDEQDPEN